MKREDKDKLLEKLNQMLEKSDEAISIWNRLLKTNEYPEETCLKQIDINNQQKKAILKMIEKHETRKDKELIGY